LNQKREVETRTAQLEVCVEVINVGRRRRRVLRKGVVRCMMMMRESQ